MEKRKTKTTKTGYCYTTNFHEVDPKPGGKRQMPKSTWRIHAQARDECTFPLTGSSHSVFDAWEAGLAERFSYACQGQPAWSFVCCHSSDLFSVSPLVAYLSSGSASLTLYYLLCMSPASAGHSLVQTNYWSSWESPLHNEPSKMP